MQTDVDALRQLAHIARNGPDAIARHIEQHNPPESLLKVASNEVYGLALRRENVGSTRNLNDPVKPGWTRGGDDHGLPIHLPTMLEAIELHKVALALHYNDYWAYLMGLLLERVGDFSQAVAVMESLRGSYAKHAPDHVKRCRAKISGTHDAESSMSEYLDEYASALEKAGQDGGIVQMLKDLLTPKIREKKAHGEPSPSAVSGAPLEDGALDEAAQFAQRFAELLTEGRFDAAADKVAAKLRLSADDLKREYEKMTIYDEIADPGPIEVMVMQCTADMPDLDSHDVAWAYVAISGSEFNEAVTVVVSNVGEKLQISEIEWGRP